MFPCNVKEDMVDMFNRYGGSVEKTGIYMLVQHYRPENFDLVLDPGCDNEQSFEPLPNNPHQGGNGPIRKPAHLYEETRACGTPMYVQ